jgi:hypothetical protein
MLLFIIRVVVYYKRKARAKRRPTPGALTKKKRFFLSEHVKKVPLRKANSLVRHLACGDTGTSVT